MLPEAGSSVLHYGCMSSGREGDSVQVVGMDKTQGIHCADTCPLEAEIRLDCSLELLFLNYFLPQGVC